MTSLDFEHADPWTGKLVDVPALNAKVTDRIAAVVDEIRHVARENPSELRSRSLLVLGTAGSGKTHLFARLRKRCHQRAVFVLVRPGLGTGVSPRELLAHIIDALQRTIAPSEEERERKQLDVLVGALVESIEQQSPTSTNHFPLATLTMLETDPERQARLDGVLDALERYHDDVHIDYLEKLFSAPFLENRKRRVLVDYLAGRMPDDVKLALLGIRSGIAENDVIKSIKSLAVSAAHGAPIVLVFDQLENLIDDVGGSKILSYASLLSELVDTVPGLILVQLALTDEWQKRFSPKLTLAHKTRLEQEVVSLEMPTSEYREALVQEWRKHAGVEDKPFPFPFGGQRGWNYWKSIGGVTPRMLFVEFKGRLEGDIDPEATTGTDGDAPTGSPGLDDQLAGTWDQHLSRARAELMDAGKTDTPIDPGRVRSGLATLLALRGDLEPAEAVPVSGDLVALRGSTRAVLKVIQEANGTSVAASVRKAKALAESERVVVLREKRLPIKSTWAATLQAREEFTKAGGVWHHLDHGHTAHLLALRAFYTAGQSGDVSDEQGRPIVFTAVESWLKQHVHDDEWNRLVDAIFGPQSIDPVTPLPSTVAPMPPVAKTSSSSETTTTAKVEPQSVVAVPDPVEETPPDTARSNQIPASDPSVDGIVREVLGRLQLASFERIVREAKLRSADIHGGQVRRSLLALGGEVRWLGRNLVASGELS